MLASVAFATERQVVCRTYAPGTVFANETEVFRMVVLVFGYDIENHSSELLLDLDRVLREETGQMQQIPAVSVRDAIVEYSEIACKGIFLCNEKSLFMSFTLTSLSVFVVVDGVELLHRGEDGFGHELFHVG